MDFRGTLDLKAAFLAGIVIAAFVPWAGRALAESVFDGPYVGAQAGFGTLSTDLTGPREGGSTTLDDDLGDGGVSGGLFGGYGRTFERFYLGAEVEGGAYDTEWEARRSPAGREADSRKTYDIGASLRAGYLVNPGFLLYGRVGAVLAGMDTDLHLSDGQRLDRDDTLLGLRFGGGAEFATTGSLFLRFDYTFTAYEDFDIFFSDSTTTGTDHYDSIEESLFRIGLIYRFSAGDLAPWESPAFTMPRIPGFYMGVQSGYEILGGIQQGPRTGATSRKKDDASGGGPAAGLFVGIGTNIGRGYLGFEMEGSGSDAEWDLREDPSGRLSDVRKRFDLGGAVRGGYFVNPETLVYGRLGFALGTFNTDVRMGDGRAFDQDDTLFGLRLGAGVETMMSERLFLRLDYAYTRWENYTVDRSSPSQIAAGNLRLEDFDLDEHIFRVGIGYSFDSGPGRGPADKAKAKARPAVPKGQDGKGFKVGDFVISPSLTVAETYDDNIFATRDNEEDDLVTTITPALTVTSTWKRHRLDLWGNGSIVRYPSNEAEDHEHYGAGADGRYDLGPGSNVFGGLAFNQKVEDRESPDDVNGSAPTQYMDNNGYAGVFHRFGNVAVRAGGTIRRLDFDDAPSSTGTIDNDDRDRTQYTGGARLSYRLSPGYEVFAQAAADVRRYDDAVDNNALDRDSVGARVLAGIKVTMPDGIEGEAYAGYIRQDYDGNLVTVEAPGFGGNVKWSATPRTQFTGFVDRTVGETTLLNASGSLDTSAGGRVSHEVRPDTTINAGFTFTNSNYQGVQRTDNWYTATAGIRYDITDTYFIGADYRFQMRQSDIADQNHERSQVTVRVGGEF